jgi:hypothetical protein
MRKTARPVVWEPRRAQSRQGDPITLNSHHTPPNSPGERVAAVHARSRAPLSKWHEGGALAPARLLGCCLLARSRQPPAASRQPPNAKRQTPNAKRQTPNAKRQTPNAQSKRARAGAPAPVRRPNRGSAPRVTNREPPFANSPRNRWSQALCRTRVLTRRDCG